MCRGENEGRAARAHRLNISLIISTSVSALAIFSAEESWGRPPPKRKDIFCDDFWGVWSGGWRSFEENAFGDWGS